MTDAALVADIKQTITEVGQSVTLRTLTAGAYDPDTGAAAQTSTDTTRKGVPFDFFATDLRTRTEVIASGFIQATDKQLLMDADGTRPTVGDNVIIGGVEYKIITVGEINTTGTPVIYDLHLRR